MKKEDKRELLKSREETGRAALVPNGPFYSGGIAAVSAPLSAGYVYSGAEGTGVYEPMRDASYVSAYKALKDAEAKKPVYTDSYGDEMKDAYSAMTSRAPFSYDIESDAEYRRLADLYISQGKRAMLDAAGNAAALTGGYGNSYAQSAGAQAFGDYAARLAEMAPEFSAAAYERYEGEGDALRDRYEALAAAREEERRAYEKDIDEYYKMLNYYKALADDAYKRGKAAHDERN